MSVLPVGLSRTIRAGRLTAWKVLRHASRLGDDAFLASIAPSADGLGANALLAELYDSEELASALAGRDAARWREYALPGQPQAWNASVPSWCRGNAPGRVRALMLYAALRRRRPTVVIETGCFTGSDSALVLLALARNGHGHLYTLDLPGRSSESPTTAAFQDSLPHGGLPPHLAPGFLVPEALQERWTLRLGDARELLPSLLAELSADVDAFFHDSEHSYGHMMWEYTTVAPSLAPRALLASDDLAANTAFWDFCVAFGLPWYLHTASANLGATVWTPRHA